MTLTAKDVAEITKLLEESSFDELYLELDGVKLSLRRGGAAGAHGLAGSVLREQFEGAQAGADGAQPARALPSGGAAGVPGGAAGAASPLPERPEGIATSGDPNVHDVSAPLLGTFYRAPKPGAPPFVEVGAEVEQESIIGIIEVMKLMNTVRAGVRGRVTEILARDGALVEYGETLLRVGTS